MAHRATLEKLMRLTLGPLLCVPGFGVICESTFWANGGVPVRFLVLAVGFTLPRTFRTHMVVGVPWFRGPDPLVRVAFGLHGLALEPRGPWELSFFAPALLLDPLFTNERCHWQRSWGGCKRWVNTTCKTKNNKSVKTNM